MWMRSNDIKFLTFFAALRRVGARKGEKVGGEFTAVRPDLIQVYLKSPVEKYVSE